MALPFSALGALTGSVSSFNVTYPSVVAGDLLLLVIQAASTTGGYLAAGLTAQGFSAVSSFGTTATTTGFFAYQKVASGSETGNFTVTPSFTARHAWVMIRVRAPEGSDGYSRILSDSNITSNTVPTFDTTGQYGDTLFAFAMNTGSSTATMAISGFTQILNITSPSNVGGIFVGWKEQFPSGATGGVGYTSSSSSRIGGAVLAYKNNPTGTRTFTVTGGLSLPGE